MPDEPSRDGTRVHRSLRIGLLAIGLLVLGAAATATAVAGEGRQGRRGHRRISLEAGASEAPVIEVRFELDAAEAARAGMVAARKAGGPWISYAAILGIVLWNTAPPAWA